MVSSDNSIHDSSANEDAGHWGREMACEVIMKDWFVSHCDERRLMGVPQLSRIVQAKCVDRAIICIRKNVSIL